MISVARTHLRAASLVALAFLTTWQPLHASADEPGPADAAPEAHEDGSDETARDQEQGTLDDRGNADQADRAAAESLLNVGKGLMELGQLEEACEKLQGSLDAHFIGDAAMLLAQCQERRGLIASAWASYRQAAARFRKLDDDRAGEAQLRSERLHIKVPRLTILASVVPGFEITRGDTKFGDGVLGVPLAVDPGTHRIQARAPGYDPWTGEITLRPSERKTITIPALDKATVTAALPTVASPLQSAQSPGMLWTAGLITGASGIVSIGVGALLGGLAAVEVDEATSNDSLCGSDLICTPAGTAKVAGAERLAVGSTVLLSVGGAALISGFVMVLLDEPRPNESAALVTPWISPTDAGVSVGGIF